MVVLFIICFIDLLPDSVLWCSPIAVSLHAQLHHLAVNLAYLNISTITSSIRRPIYTFAIQLTNNGVRLRVIRPLKIE